MSDMRCQTFLTTSLLACLVIVPQLYAGKPGCSDVSTAWTIQPYYADGLTRNAIQPDAGGAYINGKSGVTATIQICNGTNDAVLMAGSTRQISFNFINRLASNAQTPSWASGIVSGTGATLHIRKLTFVPAGSDRAQEYGFTTWAGSILPVRGSWNLRMWNPNTDAMTDDPATNIHLATANGPYVDTLVNVHHCPANSTATSGVCAGVTRETWFVWPNAGTTTYLDGSPAPVVATQVAAIVDTQKSTPVNGGQFSMPFLLTITVQ